MNELHDEYAVTSTTPCTFCGARAGERCVTRGGKVRRSHQAREIDWVIAQEAEQTSG